MHHSVRPRLGLAVLLGLLTVSGTAARPATPSAAAPAACPVTGHLISGPTLNRNPNGNLWAVAAAGPGDVWAAGYSGTYGSTLLAHWTGTTWEQMSSPADDYARYPNAILIALAVVNPRDIWAAGRYELSDQSPQPLVEHWNGTTWAIRPAPPQARGVALDQVAVSGPADVWLTGQTL